jgi:hypothetical protein
MVLDLNRLPYFDDYNEDKGFHRILFKPGVAVQARELTQLQTILQKQIERFGDHIFENGSRVLGGSFDPYDPIPYVRVNVATSTERAALINKELTGAVTGLKARVIHAEADPQEAGITILFLSYTDSNGQTEVQAFQNENLTYVDNSTVRTLTTTTTNTAGFGSVFGISEGVSYVQGFFVKFDAQKIALDAFNSRPSKRVYFKATFSVIDSNADTTLLDPSQGFNNFNAPGADRLKCELTLVSSDIDVDLRDDSHYLLFEVRSGEIIERNERTFYSQIANELAKRTFDESGDYVVRGWDVRSREHLNTGSNGGKYSADEGGDPTKVIVELGKGLAYVKGYEVETISTRPIAVNKSTDFNFVDEQSSFVTSGPHIIVNEMMGVPDPDGYIEIDLYDTAETRITSGTRYNVSPTGTKIGTARLVSVIEESGVYGTADGEIRLFINDVRMNTGKSFADVRAVYAASSFFADVVLDASGNAVLYNSTTTSKLMYVGNDYVRAVKDSEGNSDFTLTFAKQSAGEITTGGAITGIVSLAAGNTETLIYGTQTLGDLAKEQLILTVTEDAVVSVSGNVTTTSANTEVTGTDTTFNSLNLGDRLRIDSSLYTIASIQSDTALTLETAASSDYTGTFTKEYLAGDLIDLNSFGADGGRRVVSATPTGLTIDLNETFTSATNCKLTYRVKREGASEITKNIRAKRYVVIDGSTANTETTNELTKFYLGVSDVFNIRQVRKHSDTFSAITDGEDVTSDFTLNSNVRASHYDTSYVYTQTPIANTEYLLIEFDYYDADVSGGGFYFSIDSYPINDSIESDTTIQTVDLTLNQRSFLDFRQVKADSATPSTVIGSAPTNPTLATTFKTPASGGYRQPVPGTNIIFDYSYYLARRDALVAYPDGRFKVVEGRAAEIPPFPKLSESYMLIANILVPPYPSISQNYAKILDRLDRDYVTTEKVTFARHTMRDIGAMKERIKNLEYYNALSLLEKNTVDLTITDENGLDRFKNGVYINPFADHSLSDTANPDYNIAIDRRGKLIRPAYDVDGFDTNYSTGSNVVKTGALVHLPYTETVLKEQLLATTTRNIELSSYRYIGELNVYPDVDTWVDTTTVDKTIEFGNTNDLPEGQVVSVEYGAWQTIASGGISGQSDNTIKIYHRNGGDMTFNGNETLLATVSSVEEVIRYIAASNSKLFPGSPSTDNPNAALDITNANLQRYLDSSSRKRYFIVYGGTVSTEETVLQQRTNIETFLTSQEVLSDIGTYVTDASLIPYIRPQTLKLYAYGLKPNTRFYVFFDDENMIPYTAPVNIEQYFSANAVGATDNGYQDYDVDLSLIGDEGDPIFSNNNGEVLAFLRLPSGVDKRFTTGEKQVIITDNPTNDSDASSYAKGRFTSSGLNLQKQNTILSTKTFTEETREVTETREQTIKRDQQTPSGWFEVGPSCAAYSVYIDEPEDVEGVFLSSVDIWLSALDPNLGVWFEIREMSNDGNITRNTIPYSTVWMNRSDPRLNVSTDGLTNATNVNFNSPVFLYNKTQYAFVIHTEGLNPNTYFWVSRLGETDISSGNPVTNRGLFGTFYTTNNNLNWDIVPDIDLKIRFNRIATGATTTSAVTGSATFVIEDVEFISSNNTFAATFFYDGEPIRGSEILNISIDGANTIVVGDTILDSVSNTIATVIDVDGTDIYTDGFDYIVGANVEIYAEGNTAIIRDTGSISSVDFGMGVVDKINTTTKRFDIIHSNGKFFVGSVLRSVLPNRHKSVLNGTDLTVTYTGAGSAVPNPYAPTGTITLPVGLATDSVTAVPTHTIEAFTTFDYGTSMLRPSFLNFDGDTSVTFSNITTTGNTISTTPEAIYPNADKEFNSVKNILSRSEEVRLLNGEKSFKINATLSTTSDYLTPVLDATLMGNVFTLNQLNNDTTDENLTFGGALESKFISQVIQLTEDNAAEDLMVLLQEYRPETTDVKVWARLKSSSDLENIRVKDWFELTASKTAVSSSTNKENYIDTTYQIPAERLTGDGGAVQYTLSGNLAVINATEMVANTEYVIDTVGTTDFTEFGAANNEVGLVFTATSPATGTGTVSLADDIIYTRFTEFQIKVGMLGSNRAVYPKASQLRAIALQR